MDVVQGLGDGVHVGDDLVSGTLVEVEVDPAAQDRDYDTYNNKEEHFQSPLTLSGQINILATFLYSQIVST